MHAHANNSSQPCGASLSRRAREHRLESSLCPPKGARPCSSPHALGDPVPLAEPPFPPCSLRGCSYPGDETVPTARTGFLPNPSRWVYHPAQHTWPNTSPQAESSQVPRLFLPWCHGNQLADRSEAQQMATSLLLQRSPGCCRWHLRSSPPPLTVSAQGVGAPRGGEFQFSLPANIPSCHF